MDVDLPEVHAGALDATRRLVAGIGRRSVGARCRCATSWTVRELVNHIVTGNYWAEELASGKTIEEVGDRLDGDVLGDDPLGGVRRLRRLAPPPCSGRRARWKRAVRGVVRAGARFGLLRPPVPRRARPRLGRREVDRAGHDARSRPRRRVLDRARAPARDARRRAVRSAPTVDGARRRRPPDPAARSARPQSLSRDRRVARRRLRDMGQLITVSRCRPGASPVGADLQPQPFDHRHGDRALRVGRRRQGRAATRRARAAASSTWAPTRSPCTRARSRCRPHPSSGPSSSRRSIETIEHLFGYYGDDAGWSPDALRAIGVEPLPTPEPSA